VNKPTGILTGGDVQKYWTSIGIPSNQQPTVVVIPVAGAKNAPDINDDGSTQENAIDVEIVGANCAMKNATILFYIAPLTFDGFYQAFYSAINNKVSVGGQLVSPSVISCSWGCPELCWSSSDLFRFNALFAAAASKGINICCATGDDGSSDGMPGINADFPSSSPYVIACGGTSLRCSNLTYDSNTTEVAWSSGGGGVSAFFAAPAFQIMAIKATKRSIPDIAMNADPITGINIMVNGGMRVYGGTSCVAPAMAAYIARRGLNKFATPLLYAAKSTAFHDVKTGSNGAYVAKVGYDTCTGLGSINGVLLSATV
jgi:kumamolisin